MKTVIIRHPKERLSKCSLEPLRARTDLTFYKATKTFTFDADQHILLSVGAPPLSEQDRGLPLLLLDSTWRLLPQLETCLRGEPIRRSFPVTIATAFPRVSKIAEDPHGGLASVEALYLASYFLGVPDESLLAHYHWKDQFLQNVQNALRK